MIYLDQLSAIFMAYDMACEEYDTVDISFVSCKDYDDEWAVCFCVWGWLTSEWLVGKDNEEDAYCELLTG